MNKFLIALGFTLAASTGAFAQTSALDAYTAPSVDAHAAPLAAEASSDATGATNDLVSYARAGNDGSPTFAAPQGGIDYTATSSIGGVSNDQVIYDRAGNDGSPSFR